MRPFSDVVKETHLFFKKILDESNKERYDLELYRYCGAFNTLSGTAREVRFVYDLLRLARFDPKDKIILDAGCGFGRLAFILLIMGAKKVYGVDLYQSRLQTLKQIIEDLDMANRIEAFLEDVSKMHFADKTFDMILTVEAISHFHNIPEALAEFRRVLKVGGYLIISDGNNGANPRTITELHHLWERSENGPPGKVGEHNIAEPYRDKRARLIRENFPQIDAPTAAKLAAGTSGMRWTEIAQAVERFLATGEMPQSVYQRGTCPCEPVSGSRAEYACDPRDLSRMIQEYGFKSRYYAYFGGASGNPLVRFINQIGMSLTPLTVRWARGFRIVAVRQQ